MISNNGVLEYFNYYGFIIMFMVGLQITCGASFDENQNTETKTRLKLKEVVRAYI